jgi:hypothetical protein
LTKTKNSKNSASGSETLEKWKKADLDHDGNGEGLLVRRHDHDVADDHQFKHFTVPAFQLQQFLQYKYLFLRPFKGTVQRDGSG